ncbi:MAG: LysR family transcriptional regulator [Methylococcales bacterium]|nr:LysR family transcriptional regulator [Methylococcales bacterium]
MQNSHLLGAMQCFISVVDSGSFSECARQLNLSQPSVSRQVNALEEFLGVRLLQRTTRRLSLTEAGQIYYERVRKIQLDVIDAGLAISGFKDSASGLLKVSAPHSWVEAKIAPFLADFLQQYPDIEIDIECNNHIQDLIEDQLDVVIRVGELKDSSFVAVPFGTIQMVLCATPAYVARCGTPKNPMDLANHNCIVFKNFDQWCFPSDIGTRTVGVSGSVHSNEVTVMLSVVEQNIGLTMVPELLIRKQLQQGTLVDLMPSVEVEIKNLPLKRMHNYH